MVLVISGTIFLQNEPTLSVLNLAFNTRGVTNPLFTGSESRKLKKLKIFLWIRIQALNLYRCYNSAFYWIRILIRNHPKLS